MSRRIPRLYVHCKSVAFRKGNQVVNQASVSFMPQIGKVLIISGIVMLTMGCFLVFFSDKIKWFGNLPLDFSYKRDSTRFYAPIGSMILLSAILSTVANIFYRFFK